MEWLMVFWVVLIVAVPTVLWFVMFERRRAREDREKSPGAIQQRRNSPEEMDPEKMNGPSQFFEDERRLTP